MADIHQVLTSSTLVHTSIGMLAGLVISAREGTTTAQVTCYDGTDATGTKIFEVYLDDAGTSQPMVIFFADRFAPRYSSGLYVSINAAVVNLWASGV